MPQVLTKPGTRKLSDVARHVVVPAGIVSTGYPAVRDKCRDLGIVHDDWQQGLGRLILGKRKTGKYAATVGGVVMSIPRQVGKTFTVGSIIFALCLLFPGMTVLWTAHRTRTSNETFRAMQGLAGRSKVKPFIKEIRRTNGEQEITFRNGSRIMFGAREAGFGRGFAEVDIEVFDEAQILTERALEDMVAATNQSHHPAGALLFYMGTPPRPIDPGEAFTNKRTKALENKAKDLGDGFGDIVYVELSADPNADPDDRKQWAIGNPSYPKRTPEEAMQRLRENVGSDESFLREGLGIWDSDGSTLPGWGACEDGTSLVDDVAAFGIAVTPDRAWASIGVAGLREDRMPLLKLIDHDRGTGWVLERCRELADERSGSVFVIDGGGPASSLIDPLIAAGLPVEVLSARDLGESCAWLTDAVAERRVFHAPQDDLDAAVAGAKRRNIGDGMFAFGRRLSTVDISPLEAVAVAAHILPSVIPLDDVTITFI